MKQLYLYLSLFLFAFEGYAQSTAPTTLNAGGGAATVGANQHWQYSIGETFIYTVGTNPILTQGFNQPLSSCPAPLIVTKATDNDPQSDGSGECGDLRYAINWANDNDLIAGVPDSITFKITEVGGPVYSIGLLNPLPAITDALTIKGRSQNTAIGSTDSLNANHGIRIIINAADNFEYGLEIASDNVTIRGLSIINAKSAGVYAENVKDLIIEGCFIGIHPDGTGAGNAIGVHLVGVSATNSSLYSSRIGGGSPKDINVISGNSSDGIRLENCQGLTFARNFIGLSPNLTTIIQNEGDGINLVDSENIQIGVDLPGGFNFIAGNGSSSFNHQIFIEGSSSDIVISHNRIGLFADGTLATSVGDGIHSEALGTVVVGNSELRYSNYIAGTNNGIEVGTSPSTLIYKNAIFSNTNKGISNAFDPIPSAILGLFIEAGDTLIRGTAHDDVSLIQVYADLNDQGRVYLGEVVPESDNSWELTFTKAMLDRMNSLLGLSTTKYLTYTESYTPSMGHRTSEFSAPYEFSICPPKDLSASYGIDPTCAGGDGLIVIKGLSEGVEYDYYYKTIDASVVTNTATADGDSIVFSSLSDGTYTDIYIDSAGCFSDTITSLTLTQPVPPVINNLADADSCRQYTLPAITGTDLTGNEAYYSASGGMGTPYTPGDVIITSQTVFIYDSVTATPSCFSEESFEVTIHEIPVLDPLSDTTACDDYTFPTLSVGSFHPQSGGVGTFSNNSVNSSEGEKTVYIYAESGTNPNCIAEDSIVVDFYDTPETQSFSNLTECGSYTLPSFSVGYTDNEYFTAPNGGGVQFNPGEEITSTQTIYVYHETGPGCSDQGDFTITILPVPTITVTPSNPTTVGGNDGSITIGGLDDGETYDVYYNGSVQLANEVSTSGEIIISNLPAETYTDIFVELNGCSSDTVASVILTDPVVSAGEALDFDGLDDKVTIPDNAPAWNLESNFTVEMWIYPRSLNNQILTYTNGCNMGCASWSLYIGNEVTCGFPSEANKINFSAIQGSDINLSSDQELPLNMWTHVGVTYDGIDFKMYINGVLQSGQINKPGMIIPSSVNRFIGLEDFCEIRGAYKGKIDEFRIWNRALCEEEINAYMNADLLPNKTNLTAQYSFNQGYVGVDNSTVTTLVDSVDATYNGTLVGFALSDTTSNWVAPGAVTPGTIATSTTCPTCNPLLVTKTSDVNTCGTLRFAINHANNNTGADTIRFSNSIIGETILLTDVLPVLTDDRTFINGLVNTDTLPDINIDGSGLVLLASSQLVNGLEVRSNENIIQGLAIYNMPVDILSSFSSGGRGISINNATNNTIRHNYIGTTTNQDLGVGNGGHGISLENEADYTFIHSNLFIGNGIGNLADAAQTAQISIDDLTWNCNIHHNLIGTTTNGTVNTIPDNAVGISINQNSSENLIAHNVILNQYSGVMILSSIDNMIINNIIGSNLTHGLIIDGATAFGNEVYGNYLGTDNSFNDLGNGESGVVIRNNANSNTIGNYDAINLSQVNHIHYNQQHGILIENVNQINNIDFNFIGTDLSDVNRANGGDGIHINNGVSQNMLYNLIGFNGGSGIAYSNNSNRNVHYRNYFHRNLGGGVLFEDNTVQSLIPKPVINSFDALTGIVTIEASDISIDTVIVYADFNTQGYIPLGRATRTIGNFFEYQLTVQDSVDIINYGLDSLTAIQGEGTFYGLSSSEFSEPVSLVSCDPLIVTKTTDDGSCGTLRGAVEYLEANGLEDTIRFSLPASATVLLDNGIEINQDNIVIDAELNNITISTAPGFIPITTTAQTVVGIDGDNITFNNINIEDASGNTQVLVFVSGDNFTINNGEISGASSGIETIGGNKTMTINKTYFHTLFSPLYFSGQNWNVSIDGSHFGYAKDGTLGSITGDEAVYFESSGGTLNISNSYFSNIGNNGMTIHNATDIKITDNVFGRTSDGTISIVGLPINFASGVTGATVSNNLIIDNFFGAITVFDNSTVTIENNKIVGGALGVAMGGIDELDITTSKMDLSGNSISGISPKKPIQQSSNANYFPTILTVNTVTGVVTGTLNLSTPLPGFRIELFATATNQADTSIIVSPGQNPAWSVTVPNLLSYGLDSLTATATFNNNTSELSKPFAIFPCQHTADAGNDTTLCNPTSIQLDGGVIAPATSGTWTAGDGIFSNPNDSLATYTFDSADFNNDSLLFVFTPTGLGGCKVNPDTMVVYFAQPPVFDLGLDTLRLCGDDTLVQYTVVAPTTISWTNTSGVVLSTQDTLDISFDNGPQWYFATITNTTCSAVDSFYFESAEALEDGISFDAGNDIANGTVTLRTDFGLNTSIEWYEVNQGMIPETNETLITNLYGAGLYYFVRSSITGTCSVVSDTLEVTDSNNPCREQDTTFTIADTSICLGDNIVITSNDNLPIIWEWFDGSNWITQGTTNPYILTTLTAGFYEFRAILDTASCADTVLVQQKFEIKSAGSTTLTSNQTVLPATLTTDADATEYSWYRGITPVATTIINELDVTSSGNYRVRKDTAFCDVASEFVKLCADTTIQFARDSITICAASAEDVELTGAFARVTWYVNGSEQTLSDTAATTLPINKTSEVYATVRVLNGCVYTTDTVQVTAVDVNGISTTITGDTVIIDGVPVTLTTVQEPEVQSIVWNDNSTAFELTTNTPGNYSFIKYVNGCEVISDTVTVIDSNTTISTLIPGTIATDETTICTNSTASFTSSADASGGTPPLTYSWEQSINGTNWSSVGASNSPAYTSGALTASTYFRRAVTDGVDTVFTNSILVTVSPTAGPTISGPIDLCANNTTELTASGNATDTYQWYIDGRKAIGETKQSITAFIEGDYTVENLSASCGGQSNALDVEYDASAIDPIVSQPASVLTTQTGNGYTYQWYVSYEGKVLAIVGATNSTYLPIYSGTYYLSINTGKATCTRISSGFAANSSSGIDIARVSLNTTSTSIYIPVASVSSSIQVIPNPALEDFDVTYTSGTTGSLLLSIIDMNGVEVMSESLYKDGFTTTVHVYDLNKELNAGIYLIKIVDGDAVNYEKVMME